MVEEWRGTKESLYEGEEESEKAGLRLNIQKTKIMTSGPVTLWRIEGEKNGNSGRFSFWDSKITADCNCSHEIQRRLLLEEKL